jgi:TIR domain
VASIFISYRREDAGGHAGRLCDRLTARFGGDRVFMDIQDIHPGQNFATSIEDTIATCACVIAVIGPHWLETIRKRAESRDDFVHHEIAAALKRQVAVIPVLVGAAHMPASRELPAELAELSFHNAIEIRDERFDDDVVELETFLANALHVPGNSAAGAWPRVTRGLLIAIPIVLIACALAGYTLLRPARTVTSGAAIPAAPVIDGEWVAEMKKPGQPPFRIRLSFRQVGDTVGGMVQYPTGDSPMHDVALKGRTLTFYTSHVPQFSSSPATIRLQAEIDTDRIRLVSTDDSGVATGVATRVAPR